MKETAAAELLLCRTPMSWVAQALEQRDVLLVDHATCERKAAAAALGLIHRYTERHEMNVRLSRLAREELRHFEQVLAFMRRWSIDYRSLPAGRYAAGLRTFVRSDEPGRLLDLLLVAGVIEARSCERFARVRDADPGDLGRFYGRFCAAEARHLGIYLELARTLDAESFGGRLTQLLQVERALIETPDARFRFHSGPPPSKVAVS